MQISGLSASNSFSATDVLAIEVNVNGVEKTYKLTGATLAAALASIGSYLKTTDVVNKLTSTSTTQPLSAAQGKALNDKLASIVFKTISVDCTLPQNTTITLDLSSYCPTGYKLFALSQLYLGSYMLPYYSGSTHEILTHVEVNGNSVTIVNGASNWGSDYPFRCVAMYIPN